ncbi:hypothetical protein JTB14_014366 [Gonioctena quinquepunctata]|nr:hypothetical protein JTB14_014366 [Gonioctena quinquepunctata]
MCDKINVEISNLNQQLLEALDDRKKADFLKQLKLMETQKTLHLKRSEQFYSLKKKHRRLGMKNKHIESIAIDYQKNLPTPNITCNDVYYKRQLNFISFNVHTLSMSQAVFFTYDESVAKKECDDVTSMVYQFVYKIMAPEVRELHIFCDSCSGQNKNYTMVRLFYHLVNEKHRLDHVTIYFPIRGNSYLECDRDMSLINQKAYTEVPDDWREVIRDSRVKPTPFTVIDCGRELEFVNWTEHLSGYYKNKCPFPTRPIRLLQIKNEAPYISFENTLFGTLPLPRSPNHPQFKERRQPGLQEGMED